MTAGPKDVLVSQLLASLPVATGVADWEDVLRRALLAAEARSTGARRAGRVAGDSLEANCGCRRLPPPEEQGWGTRPIRTASSTHVAVVEGMGWGTRPM